MLKYNWILNHSPNLAEKNLTQQTQDLWSYPEKYREPNRTDADLKIDLLLNFKLGMI